MSTKPTPYSTVLETVLCQSPAVIIGWLKEQYATGQLPLDVTLRCLIELADRQVKSDNGKG